MTIAVQDAIADLYRIAVEEKKTTAVTRLDRLAKFCVQELEARGLADVETEASIPGGGRTKKWDVAWKHDGKYRLAISLKSILKNIAGTVPNRIDDMMGEATNAQLYSPEIVIGYIMIFNTEEDRFSDKHGSTWLELLRSRLRTLAGRKAPAWTAGTVEAFVLAEVDFGKSARLVSDPTAFAEFFDALVAQAGDRNPGALAGS